MVRNTEPKRQSVSISTLKIFADRVSSNRPEQRRRAKGAYMRFQYSPLKSKPSMFQPINPCPVCAETTLAEIESHPLHANFEIHGYFCDRCGPTKSLVVLRSPPLQSMMYAEPGDGPCQ